MANRMVPPRDDSMDLGLTVPSTEHLMDCSMVSSMAFLKEEKKDPLKGD